MKEFGMKSKRCLSMFLAVVMVLSCINIGAILPARAVDAVAEEPGKTVTLGVLIKENIDGLSEEEISVITSGYLAADKTYSYKMPSDKDDLITVDEKTGTVKAKAYTDPTYKTVWIPVSFDLTNGTSAIAGYKDLPMAASGDEYVGTYELESNNPGKSFTVEVTYSLDLTMSDEDMKAQQEMLDASYALAQDIALMQCLDSVSVIGDDQELADRIVELSGGLIKDPSKVYADTILEFLTMDLEQLGGQSAIDMIYELVDGIDIPYVEEIDFETGKIITGEETLRLGRDGRNAATSLYNQKKTNNALNLVKFLNAHVGASDLELLVAYGAELKDALSGNYADINYLSDLNSSGGLKSISNDITGLLEDFQEVQEDIYAEINSYLKDMDKSVSTVEQLRALITELETADLGAYDAINEELAKLDADTKAMLEKYNCPAKVEKAEDLKAVETALIKAYQDVINTVNSGLAELDAAVMNELVKAGAPKKITMADTSSLAAFRASGDQDINDLTNLEAAMKSVRKSLVNAAISEANEQLTAMYQSNSSMMTIMGIPKKVYTEKELRNLVTKLNDLAAALGNLLPQDVQANMNAGISTLDMLDEVTASIGAAKEAVAKVKPYIESAMEANEKLAQLQETILPLLADVADGLEQLESGMKQLQEKKQMLDMLILVMQAFCEAVEPANTAFANNSWNAPSLLTENADYAKLTAWARNAENKNYVAKSQLHVTTTKVAYKLDMYDVTVQYKAAVVNPAKVDSAETIELATKSFVITMTKGASAAEVLAEIAAKVDEAEILSTWAISADNYDRTTSVLPEALAGDTTYTVTYAPKQLKVTFGAGYAEGTQAMMVPYGYRMTLPALEGDATSEYTYQVNDEKNLDQGTVVTITENTAISREEGAVSAKQYLTDLVVNTTPGMDSLVKNILQSQALNRDKAISIRVPGKEQVVVTPAADASSVTISALPFGSRVGNKNWIASNAIIDGVTVQMVDGVYVEIANPAFDKVVVNYELALTAAALGITDEQLLATMNIPYELASDYRFQKSKLDALASNDSASANAEDDILGLLTMLNAQDYVIESPSKMTLKEALGKIEDLNNLLDLGLGAKAVAAAKKMYNLIPDAGYIPLYYTLQQYNEQGIIHYYKNEATYVAQITELNDILAELVGDEGFIKLIPESYKATFELIQKVLSEAAELENADKGVNKTLINVSSPYLNTLLASLNAVDVDSLTRYESAPSELVWVASIEQPGPSKRNVSMSVNFNGVEKTQTKIVGFGDVMTYAELAQWAMDMAKDLGLTEEIALYYIGSYSFSDDITVGQDVTLTASWALKNYDVKVNGTVIGSVNYEDRQITLAANENPNYQNRYYINGELYSAGTHTLTLAQFKALAEGNLVITKDTVNLQEANLIKLIENMNGAAVLTKDAEGNYSVILPINPATATDDMSKFVIGLFMTDYKYIGLGGEEFYSGQFHMQAVVDAFLNSGFGTDSLLKLIDSNGHVNNNLQLGAGAEVLTGVAKRSMPKLGGVLLETTMDFGTDANNTTSTKFYVTLNGDVAQMKQFRNGLLQAKNAGISFICKDGQLNLSVNLPDQLYSTFLAAMSMVGRADLADVNGTTAEDVIGYYLELVNPLVADDVTTTTMSNTLKKFGRDADLSSLSSYFELLKKYTDFDAATYTKDTCIVPVENISINALVNRLQSVVDGMPLPDGMSVDLTKLIYEYDEPTAEDDDTAGLDIKLSIKLDNLNTEYAALFLDIRAAGIMNKFGMWTERELLAGADDFAGTSVIILVDDVVGNLNINTTTILDLNGKTVTGNITGGKNANLIIIDTAYKSAKPGTVTGTVSGNVTILEGKYESDVSAFLDNGYVQHEDGRVSNKLFSITAAEDNNVTVTINATPAEIKELANKQGLVDLAIEMAASLVLNNYNNASLSIEGSKIYSININDIVGLYAKPGKLNSAIDTGLSWISVSDLADLVTTFIGDLTDYAALEAGLKGDGTILTYNTSVAPWKFEFIHVAEGDYMSMNIGASEETEEVILNIAITGELKDNLANLAGGLKDTVHVDVVVDMDDIARDENNVINVIGSFKGVVEIDFAHDPNYVIMMAVILADGADSTLKAKLVAGIETYYETKNMDPLADVFRALTVKQICDSLSKNARSELFTAQVNSLALSAAAKGAILSAINDNEMGFKDVIDLISFALRQLQARGLLDSITESGRTLGSLERADACGSYFGFTRNKLFTGEGNIFRDYKLGYDLDISELTVNVRLFHTHDYQEVVDEKYLKEAATCTTLAVYYKSCVCGLAHPYETFTYGELAGHDLLHIESNPATTTADGNIEYWYCNRCGKYFADEAATLEITKADTIIAALPTVSVPAMPVGNAIYGFKVDADSKLLIIDAVAEGITVEEFLKLINVAVTNDVDNIAEIIVTGAYNNGTSNLVCTTSQITFTAENVDGVKETVTYDIVMLGDANCNGRMDSGDVIKIKRHYQELQSLTGLALIAADCNRNGRLESGDAVKIKNKYQNGENYVTALNK